MAQRRFHYELAFERYLRARGLAYVAVNEARRAVHGEKEEDDLSPPRLKNFDFVVYSRSGPNLLVDVKGRKLGNGSAGRLENWVTRADVEDLSTWQEIFGPGFEGAFVFLYWCPRLPPGSLFLDVFESDQRWYAALAVRVDDYRKHMRPRSSRWETVHLSSEDFRRLAVPMMQLL